MYILLIVCHTIWYVFVSNLFQKLSRFMSKNSIIKLIMHIVYLGKLISICDFQNCLFSAEIHWCGISNSWLCIIYITYLLQRLFVQRFMTVECRDSFPALKKPHQFCSPFNHPSASTLSDNKLRRVVAHSGWPPSSSLFRWNSSPWKETDSGTASHLYVCPFRLLASSVLILLLPFVHLYINILLSESYILRKNELHELDSNESERFAK